MTHAASNTVNTTADTIMDVRHVSKNFPIHGGLFFRQIASVSAVNDVSFSVRRGETFGLVGESGCGKSTLGKTLLNLYQPSEGVVLFEDENLATLSKKEMRNLRRQMQFVFQDPCESLSARLTVGQILEEPFIIHKIGRPAERKRKVLELLDRVGLPENAANRYPHEFSGGQRQRIGIGRAIALEPKLVLCDEPVSALDVSIQSQIINLLLDLQQEMNLTLIFIAHDLSVVKHVSDRIAVMYLGKIVELADAQTIYKNPLHPYTQALISAIPVPDPRVPKKKHVLVGDVPSPRNPPSGCRFHTRCNYAQEQCKTQEPTLRHVKIANVNNHQVACHLAEKFM